MQWLSDFYNGRKGLFATFIYSWVLLLALIFLTTLGSLIIEGPGFGALVAGVFSMISFFTWLYIAAAAHINASTYNRERGFFGWICTAAGGYIIFHYYFAIFAITLSIVIGAITGVSYIDKVKEKVGTAYNEEFKGNSTSFNNDKSELDDGSGYFYKKD